MEMLKKVFAGDIKSVSQDTYDWILSDATVDRIGESIKTDGWDLVKYNQNPVVLFSHDPKQPIGKCDQAVIEDGKLIFKGIKFATRPDNAVGEWRPDTIKALVDQGILKAASVGYIAKEVEINDKAKDGEEVISTYKAELLEGSIVSVGCNPSALRIRGISEAHIKSIFPDEPTQTNDENATILFEEEQLPIIKDDIMISELLEKQKEVPDMSALLKEIEDLKATNLYLENKITEMTSTENKKRNSIKYILSGGAQDQSTENSTESVIDAILKR